MSIRKNPRGKPFPWAVNNQLINLQTLGIREFPKFLSKTAMRINFQIGMPESHDFPYEDGKMAADRSKEVSGWCENIISS